MIIKRTKEAIIGLFLLLFSCRVHAENKQYDAIFVWTSETTFDCYCFTEHPKIVCNGATISVYVDNSEVKSFNVGSSAIKVTYGVYEVPSVIDLTLYDDADNTKTISDYKEKTVNTVTLSGRLMFKDGMWNTLCLPFDVARTGEFANATIMELDTEGYYDGNTRYLTYVDGRKQTGFDATSGTLYMFFQEVDHITAGMPCIVKWTNNNGNFKPVFTNVTITSDDANSTTSVDGKLTFLGTYAPVIYSEENKSVLYLGENNILFYPNGTSDTNINAFRSFFLLNGIETGGSNNQVRAFYFNIDEMEGISTSVRGIWVNVTENGACYDMSGRLIPGKPTIKGLYIINGKKKLVK